MEVIPLKKFKKKQLITMVENYENDIQYLTEELDTLKLQNNIVREYVVLRNEEEDKTIMYIKNRLLVIHDKHRRAEYQVELNRLLNNANVEIEK